MANENYSGITILDESFNVLKDQFNTDSNKIRFLALLSPTCPL